MQWDLLRCYRAPLRQSRLLDYGVELPYVVGANRDVPNSNGMKTTVIDENIANTTQAQPSLPYRRQHSVEL
jgi:hypothetical protein